MERSKPVVIQRPAHVYQADRKQRRQAKTQHASDRDFGRLDILAEWPSDFDKWHPATLKRWLDRAVERNLVLCEGNGRKSDPLRYWLAETEAKWHKRNPFYDHCLQQERDLKLPFKSLQERARRLVRRTRRSD